MFRILHLPGHWLHAGTSTSLSHHLGAVSWKSIRPFEQLKRQCWLVHANESFLGQGMLIGLLHSEGRTKVKWKRKLWCFSLFFLSMGENNFNKNRLYCYVKLFSSACARYSSATKYTWKIFERDYWVQSKNFILYALFLLKNNFSRDWK